MTREELLEDLLEKTLRNGLQMIEVEAARADQAEAALASFLECLPREILPQA